MTSIIICILFWNTSFIFILSVSLFPNRIVLTLPTGDGLRKMPLYGPYHGRINYNHFLKTYIADNRVRHRYMRLVSFTIYCAIDLSAYFHAKWFAPSMSLSALNRIWARTYILCAQQMLLNLIKIRMGFKPWSRHVLILCGMRNK